MRIVIFVCRITFVRLFLKLWHCKVSCSFHLLLHACRVLQLLLLSVSYIFIEVFVSFLTAFSACLYRGRRVVARRVILCQSSLQSLCIISYPSQEFLLSRLLSLDKFQVSNFKIRDLSSFQCL